MTEVLSILRNHWKFQSFRPLQEEIIQSVLEKKDTLAILPTGGGKSICFQVPALAMDGVCLVVSPLIALMKDQVENLRKKGITALSIHSGMSRKEVIASLKIASNSNCKFLYVSPERLQTSLFLEYLPSLGVNLIAVDEAHCISQWGYDFRPSYLQIAKLREELPGVPILALSASATPEVQNDICEKLLFKIPNIFRQSFERPNLSYSVFKVDSKINKLLEILNNVPGTSIVYCSSRKHTKEISQLLQLNNVDASHYHAGLPQEERNQKQQAWINGTTRVMVCTNAFGMGIDKPDVRSVVHIDVPDCLENYYQEAGRAGRDGKRSYAVLLYHAQEIIELKQLPESHFPPIEKIREIYQSLMNYLQLPEGSGRENYYDFDLKEFTTRFSFDIKLVLNSLKILEQDGVIGLNEQVFLPSTIQFTTSKEALYQFENDHPILDPIIKALLRTYEGIFDFPVAVNEKFLASLCNIQQDLVIKHLEFLHSSRLIDYNPKKDKPQIYCFTNRVRTNELVLNLKRIEERKRSYQQRVQTMVDYVNEKSKCRSSSIGKYFGDQQMKDCGICDICLEKKSSKLNETEFVDIHMRLLKLLQRPLHSKDVIKELAGVKKEKAWKVIDLLQAENKIEVDIDGWIRKK